MTGPDFSPVTGNRIRPVNDCQCSTRTALRSAPEAAAAAQIHRPVFTIDTSDEVGGLRHQLSEARRERDDALAAAAEWKATVGRWADIRDVALTERDTARAENERLRGELELAKASARMGRVELARVAAERDVLSGVRESLRLCRRELSEVDRKLRDANADRDRAIAERDEARKAMADRGGVTLGIYANACRTRDEAFAELAALRARVAELEAEKVKAKALDTVLFVTADEKRWTAAEYYDFTQARIAELEKKIEAARDNPLTLFGDHSMIGRTHAIDRNRSFVGVIVDVCGGKRAHVEAIKRIASWL